MTKQERTETCATCRFWDGRDYNETIAQCRRRAPSGGVWWFTKGSDWCGEWQGEKGESE